VASRTFEELDFASTPLGEVTLRRRTDLALGREVFEVKLGDEFLMSSLFTVAEVELARLGLAAHGAAALDVLVGGLGLGYTAHAALRDSRVGSLTVVEAVEAVIDWHRRDLLPDTAGLAADPRCRLVHDDFFALVAEGRGDRRYDVVLLDVDHTPRHTLHPSHDSFYEPSGLARLATLLADDGVFALWSDDPPDVEFTARLEGCFRVVHAHVVDFPNPLTRGVSSNTVYVARHLRDGAP
jgi:spermidine synthase